MKWQITTLQHCEFTTPESYEIVKSIGSGAYGMVALAIEKPDNKLAIKKLLRPFQDTVTAKRTYRELKLLLALNNEDSGVIQLIDVYTPDTSIKDFKQIYLVFPYVPYDLNKVIQSGVIQAELQIRVIVYSILRSIKYIHSAGIIHRDLKPSNIGLDEDLNTWILDFGLARQCHEDTMTGYVATRWWRAPEILFNANRYNETADIWSVGCIMAEMMNGKPLFPGNDQLDQIKKILTIVGTTDEKNLSRSFDENTNVMKLVFSNLTSDGKGIDLLQQLLQLNPADRISADEALKHPYLLEFHDPDDEPTTQTFVDPFEGEILSTDEWKAIIYEIIKNFPNETTEIEL